AHVPALPRLRVRPGGVSVCVLVAGVILAQYIFTLKRKMGLKTRILEMIRHVYEK
uniref:Uncharacterized protein n=1 Tax=Marmota marmota marmota TaxID=9994 RepID=A0A8C5ZWC0_MARMA